MHWASGFMGLVMPNCPVYRQNQKQSKGKENRQAVVTYYLLFNLRKNECIQLLALLSRGNFGTDHIKEYLVLDYYLDYLKQVRRLSIS